MRVRLVIPLRCFQRLAQLGAEFVVDRIQDPK